MTEEDKKLINVFESRLRQFMLMYDQLCKENEQLRSRLSEKEVEIAQLHTSIKDLEAMYANLKTARTISLFDNDIKETKQRLSGLVREIDKCIALLND